jgi:hypothetical protein
MNRSATLIWTCTVNVALGASCAAWVCAAGGLAWNYTPSAPQRVVFYMYSFGLLPSLLLFVEGCFAHSRVSWVSGLCLTVPMYGALLVLWYARGGQLPPRDLAWGFALLVSGALLAPGAQWIASWLRRRWAKAPLYEPCCPTCGYCLRGLTSGICPECGTPCKRPDGDLSNVLGENKPPAGDA